MRFRALLAVICAAVLSIVPAAPSLAQTYQPGTPVRDTNPLPVKFQRSTATVTNGTIATGGTFQTVLAASTTRKGCILQNRSAATMRLFIGANASATDAKGIELAVGEKWSCGREGVVLTDEINLTATSSGGAFVVVAF